MILIDVNLLLYSVNSFDIHHAAAHGWLRRQLSGTAPVGLPWVALLGFLRLATNRRIVTQPLNINDAWRQVGTWLACEQAWIPQPTERHAEILGEMLALPGIHSNLVPDAHLAALAIEHGLTLCSTDGGFARFPKLKWENPIAR